MNKQYKEWLQEQTFETLATDNYNIKLLLLAEQAKNKELEYEANMWNEQTNIQKDVADNWFSECEILQAKNKKLVEIINSIVKYCAKTDTIEWFDYDNIEAIADEVNNAK